MEWIVVSKALFGGRRGETDAGFRPVKVLVGKVQVNWRGSWLWGQREDGPQGRLSRSEGGFETRLCSYGSGREARGSGEFRAGRILVEAGFWRG